MEFECLLPKWCAVAEAGRLRKYWARRVSSHAPNRIPMSLIPEASCSQKSHIYSLFHLKKGLTVWFLPVIFIVWQTVCREARKSQLQKGRICLPPLIACAVTGALQLMPMATLLRSQPEMDRKRENRKAHKNHSALVNCFKEFKEQKGKQLKIQL